MTDLKKYQFNLPTSGAPVTGALPGWGQRTSAAAMSATVAPVSTELPEDAAGCLAKGNGWLQGGRVEDALRAYDRAIALQPDYLEPHFNRGNVLLRLQRLPEALAAFERAIALSPELAIAHYNRATILGTTGRADEAMAGYQRALALDPAMVQARFNLGNLYLEKGDAEQALACMDQVIAQAPNVVQAHLARGNALMKMKKLEQAGLSFDRALALQPRYPEALSNRGNVRLQTKQYAAALADLEASVRLNPNYAQTQQLLGALARDTKRPEEALERFQKAYDLAPEKLGALSDLVGAMAATCDWHWLPEGMVRIEAAIQTGQKGIAPFPLLALSDSPALQLECARRFAAVEYPAGSTLGSVVRRAGSSKIRVGYYSADFHEHATAYLMAQLFEQHDRSQFEWFAFSYGPNTQDPMRQRLRKAFTQFLDVSGSSDLEVAALSRELGIDVAVDLKGFTRDERMGIFANRCAPVQVSYLGYPGTTGADYMDYVIADPHVLPASLHPYFTEKVVTLPHSYQVNDASRRIADRVFTREEVGLPEEGFVFCCFNNNYKILPAVFACWMRVLLAVEGSVLWLLADNDAAVRNLQREAAARGVDPKRLAFAPRMPLADHLARHALADLFLDTLPYNAHTTTSDALWAGLPVLTQTGSAFAGRVSTSLLNAVGLPELVTTTQAEYAARAIELARDATQLRGLRDRLAANRLSSPLFNAKLFARHIEAAYIAMDERSLQGLPPKAMEIRA